MPVIQIIVILIVIGVLMWLVNTQLGAYIAQPWLKLINIVAVIITVLWLLGIFLGGFGTTGLWNWRVGPH